MPVTFSLPTVLAKLADGHQTIKATGATLGDVVTDIAGRFPRLAPRPAGARPRREVPDLRRRWPPPPGPRRPARPRKAALKSRRRTSAA